MGPMIESRFRAALIAALSLVVATRVHAACSFSGASYSAGTAPHAVALADLNRDNRPDMVLANSGSNNITVRLGNGSGGFGTATLFTVGTAPVYVAAGDFNADGNRDLAVANRDSTNVSVLIGDGTGGFASAVSYAVFSQPHAIAAADFNRDGRTDLAVANYQGGSVSVLLGNGDGTFAAQTSFNAGGAIALAAGDFNRDGNVDLAVVRKGVSQVQIFTGTGTGSFGFGASIETEASPQSIAAADLNRDGFLDLVSANEGNNSVSVALGATNGNFGTPAHYTAGTAPRSIVAVDLSGDGKIDVAVANADTDNLSIFDGNGDGTLQTKVDVSAGNGPRGLAVARLTSDVLPDLVIANELSNDATTKITNPNCANNCGSFASATTQAVGTSPQRSARGDFNRDGKLDLAVPNAGSDTVSILLGAGDGTFTAGTAITTLSQPNSTAAGDFNRDGKLDLAVGYGDTYTISIFLGTGSGTFTTAASPPALTASTYDVTVADFNNDGKLDLAAPTPDFGTIAVILGNGNGTFAAASSINSGVSNPQVVEVADFNRDGKTDLATIDDDATVVAVLLGNGTGGFAAATTSSAGGKANDLIAGDFNRDGIPDLAVSGRTTILATLIGAGNGAFGAPQTVTLSGMPGVMTAIDTNNGVAVVATVAGTNTVVRVFLNTATGAPQPFNIGYFEVGTAPAALVGGDFNRDGRDDVVVSNSGSQNVSILANFCIVSLVRSSSSNPSYYGASVTFTAGISGTVGIAPTGTMTFRHGTTELGTVTLPAPTTASTNSLPIGTQTITITYSGDAFYTPATTTLSQLVLLAPPTDVYAIPNETATQVTIGWQPAYGGTNYTVYRSFNNGALTIVGQSQSNTLTDTTVSPNVTYLYRIRTEMPRPEGGVYQSQESTRAAATTIVFTDDPIVAGSTPIKLIHLTQLRTGVNLFRAAGGLSAYDFTETTPTVIKAVHIQEVSARLSEAWSAAGLSIGYGGPFPGPGEIVTASQFLDLRRHIRAAPYGGEP